MGSGKINEPIKSFALVFEPKNGSYLVMKLLPSLIIGPSPMGRRGKSSSPDGKAERGRVDKTGSM
jgi:hypothetical protein